MKKHTMDMRLDREEKDLQFIHEAIFTGQFRGLNGFSYDSWTSQDDLPAFGIAGLAGVRGSNENHLSVGFETEGSN